MRRAIKKKCSFTLLEIVISTFIIAILLGTLFSLYFNWNKQIGDLQKAKESLYPKMIFREKLAKILWQTGLSQAKEKGIFHLEDAFNPIGKTLLFSYDNAIDPDIDFSGTIYNMLVFSSSTHKVFLYSWKNEEKIRAETLLDHIAIFSLEFFDDTKKMWVKTWSKKEETLPSMIRISLKDQSQEDFQTFTFFLPSATAPILYETTKGKL